jgi:hypothetical protein
MPNGDLRSIKEAEEACASAMFDKGKFEKRSFDMTSHLQIRTEPPEAISFTYGVNSNKHNSVLLVPKNTVLVERINNS